MIPYIVVLVFIIAMILWVVYGQLKDEGFGDSPSIYKPLVITDKTTLTELLEEGKKRLEFLKTVKATLDMPTAVLPNFTPQEIGMETLNIVKQEKDGKTFYRGPIEDSPTLLGAFRALLKSKYDEEQRKQTTTPPGINVNQTFKAYMLATLPFQPGTTNQQKEVAFTGMLDYLNKKDTIEFALYQRILDANKKTTVTTTTGTTTTGTTATGTNATGTTATGTTATGNVVTSTTGTTQTAPVTSTTTTGTTQKPASGNVVTSTMGTTQTAPVTTTTTTGTTQNVASGNVVRTQSNFPALEIDRIYAMVGSPYDNNDKPVKDKKVTDVAAPEAEMNTTKPKEKKITDSKPDSAPGCSDNFSKELEDRLAKNITKQIRDDMLSQRALTDVRPSSNPCMADTMPSTNLTQQGYEYQHSKPLDMNDYIRKDSIPCWGCSLPQ